MSENQHFSLSTFTDTTKKVCMCSAISIFLIILFVISPLSNYFLTSVFMKIITLMLLAYTLYLNIIQINYLRNAASQKQKEEISQQLTVNIVCSYIFTLFIGLLFIFVGKSFF
jgi:hypothetical protein